MPENINRKGRPQDWINREYMDTDAKLPITQSFNAGLDYIKRNMNDDNWFLQLETFDPHEPFFTHREHKDRYAEHYDNYTGPKFDWPGYEKVTETPDQVEHAKYNYASLLSLCDKKLGDILDLMDANNMWDDTMLVVCTDHGFMFGEHDCWAKNWMPLYEEVAHTPFFVWDPRYGKRNERRQALVQPCLDLAPTLLGLFNLEIPTTMTGKDLAPAIADDTGLEVEFLNGAPGVYSARYAGNNVSYQDNVRKLLSDLKGVEQKFRNAKFRTYISFCSSENEFWVDGSIEGEITEKPLGENGFGYDSVFLVKETGLTFGQMDKKDKDKISHRGLALKKMISLLEQNIN